MAVLVVGANASVLRLKIAALAWDEEDLREAMGTLARWRDASPSKLLAQVEDDDDEDDEGLLYTVDLEPGVAPPAALPAVKVRSFVYGAVVRGIDGPALEQALEVCDAVILIVPANHEGVQGALHVFSRAVGRLTESDPSAVTVPFVVQWTRDAGAPRQDVGPLCKGLSALFAKGVAPGRAAGRRRASTAAPTFTLETVECIRGDVAGVQDALRSASRAALASKRVEASVAGMR
jgi:hypothetical protein